MSTKYYKIVRNYNDRLFSAYTYSEHIRDIINKKKRNERSTAVEYRLNKWARSPKIGNNAYGLKLFVFNDLGAAQSMKLWSTHISNIEIFECEVKNPVHINERYINYNDRNVYLVDAVKLTKQIHHVSPKTSLIDAINYAVKLIKRSR